MPITTQAQEYARLRSYLNPYIKGPNTTAVLNALAAGSSSYLINNCVAVNNSLYIATAQGQYLDARLSEFGLSRPPNVGLSDDVFREIGLQVKNRKQVRDLINNLLDAVFGDQFVKASTSSSAAEPYFLQDGDTLIINFDSNNTVTVTFSAAQFANINAALAQEVADAISSSLSNLGFTETAIAPNNGNGAFVQIFSSTIGPASSVTILGGSAQNKLLFPSTVPAGGNGTTQWTASFQSGGNLRYTWTGGADPNLGLVEPGNYVNIFGGGFSSSPNQGSYTITSVQGGAVDIAYFQVSNPLGVAGIFTQGIQSAVVFFNPTKQTLNSMPSYAAVYQVKSRLLQIFLPASTQVIRRSREGSAHIHYPPQGTFLLNAQPSNGDVFGITASLFLTAGVDFVIGANISDTVNNIVAAANSLSGILAVANTGNTVLILNQSLSNNLTITYSGSQNIVASGPQGDNTSLEPNQPGPYGYDLTQPFVVSAVNTTLVNELDSTKSRVVQVGSSVGFPNKAGYIILGYGTSHQEGPIPYLGTPSGTTLLISPAYTIQEQHPAGTSVFFVAQNSSVTLTQTGSDYPFYVTDVVSGRDYAESLIQSVAATGINIVFTILYPSDIGLGKWGTPYTENPIIWGP